MIIISVLNYLDARLFDIENAYLNTDTDKKVDLISGKGFGPEAYDTITVAIKVLY